MSLTILAVDPGTKTGWACSDGTGGVEDFSRGAAKLPEVERHALIAWRLTWWLESQIIRKQSGVLLIERMMSHGTAGHLLLGLRMAALMVGARRKQLVVEVWEKQWKGWAKATGWWQKSDALDAAAMLGWWTECRLPEVVG